MAIDQGDWANPERSPEVRAILRDRLQQRIRDFNREHPNPPPKNAFDQINQQIQKAIDDAMKVAPTTKAPSATLHEVQRAVKQGAVLHFNGDSTCFASLSWESDDGSEDNGTVTATFTNGYGPYTAPLDLETFLDWTEDSAGKYFNGVLGNDFFAPRAKGKGK